MPTKEYLEARKEFVNCIAMTLFGIGIPLVIAFTVWLPKMRQEQKKAQQAA